MYINFLDSLFFRQLKQTVNMSIVTVNSAVRYKSHHVKSRIVFLYIFTCCKKRFILKEISILN